MKELLVIPRRTTNQLLQRLVRHFSGDPISKGHYLYYVAQGLLTAKDDYQILLLARRGSIWIEHAILVDGQNNVVVDHNPYMDAHLSYNGDNLEYEAIKVGGIPLKLTLFKSITVEQFITKSKLHFTLKHLRNNND